MSDVERAELSHGHLQVLNNLTVDGQDLKVKASNTTAQYVEWFQANRETASARAGQRVCACAVRSVVP